jgi:hypothetical protein
MLAAFINAYSPEILDGEKYYESVLHLVELFCL